MDPPENGLYFGDQHIEMKGLLHKIVRSQLDRHDHIGRMIPGREKYNGHIGMRPDHSAPVESVEHRKSDVNQHKIGLDL
ncbi:hypothetical protein D3C72_2243470 [compost metagenome]